MKKFKIKFAVAVVFLGFLLPVFVFGAAESVVFNVDSGYDRQGRFEHKALLVAESDHAYFYLDREYWQDLSTDEDWEVEKSINTLAEEFDENIYPQMKAFWGSEWRPGIDGDEKITVLITQLEEGVGGYFNPRDEFSREEKEDSNEREMIYVNTKYLKHPRLKSFLAHEFQHLISFNQKERLRGFSDDVWLNDTRSEYSPTLLGYDENFATSNLRYRISAFESNPYISLTEWNNSDLDYGAVSLFGHYVENVYGKNVLRRTIFQGVPGIKSLEASLTKEGYEADFEQVFSDWLLASLINNPEVGEGEFAYTSPDYLQDVEIDPIETITFGSEGAEIIFTDRVREWAWRSYKFKNNDNLETEAMEISLENLNQERRGTLEARVVAKSEEGLQSLRELNLEEGAGEVNVRAGEEVESVYLIVFNKYEGEYSQNDNLGEEATIEFEVVGKPIKSEFQLDRIEPGNLLNRSGELSLFGTNLDQVERVGIGEQAVEEFKKQTQGELIFSFEKFEKTGWKNLRLETGELSLEKEEMLRVFEPVKEGKLIRGELSSRLYVVKNGFRRYLSDVKIIDVYPHLSLGEIQILKPEELELYQKSNLVRPVEKEKIYRVDKEGKKHWLDLSPQEFEESGRSWESVYIISEKEAQLYPEAEPIRH